MPSEIMDLNSLSSSSLFSEDVSFPNEVPIIVHPSVLSCSSIDCLLLNSLFYYINIDFLLFRFMLF